jgi:hypothetical protein
MKRVLVDVVIGFVIAIGILLMQKAGLAFLSIGIEEDAPIHQTLDNVTFLIAGLASGLFGFLLGLFEKTNPDKKGLYSGLVWAGMVILVFLVRGITQSTIHDIFTAYGFYVAVTLTALGPVIFHSLFQIQSKK